MIIVWDHPYCDYNSQSYILHDLHLSSTVFGSNVHDQAWERDHYKVPVFLTCTLRLFVYWMGEACVACTWADHRKPSQPWMIQCLTQVISYQSENFMRCGISIPQEMSSLTGILTSSQIWVHLPPWALPELLRSCSCSQTFQICLYLKSIWPRRSILKQ